VRQPLLRGLQEEHADSRPGDQLRSPRQRPAVGRPVGLARRLGTHADAHRARRPWSLAADLVAVPLIPTWAALGISARAGRQSSLRSGSTTKFLTQWRYAPTS